MVKTKPSRALPFSQSNNVFLKHTLMPNYDQEDSFFVRV